ncbi:hypothetical protein FRC06_006623, partial [Ceratobasidium sp. 370]
MAQTTLADGKEELAQVLGLAPDIGHGLSEDSPVRKQMPLTLPMHAASTVQRVANLKVTSTPTTTCLTISSVNRVTSSPASTMSKASDNSLRTSCQHLPTIAGSPSVGLRGQQSCEYAMAGATARSSSNVGGSPSSSSATPLVTKRSANPVSLSSLRKFSNNCTSVSASSAGNTKEHHHSRLSILSPSKSLKFLSPKVTSPVTRSVEPSSWGVTPATPSSSRQSLSMPSPVPMEYCVGAGSKKNMATLNNSTNNYDYDDERGDYLVIKHDHLAYRYEIIDTLGPDYSALDKGEEGAAEAKAPGVHLDDDHYSRFAPLQPADCKGKGRAMGKVLDLESDKWNMS